MKTDEEGDDGRRVFTKSIVLSSYLLPENHYFYEGPLRRWETLSRDLNYNVMYSTRGVIELAHSYDERVALARRGARSDPTLLAGALSYRSLAR